MSALEWYLKANLFLTLAYGAYRLLEKSAATHPRALLRWGQGLLLVSLLLPAMPRLVSVPVPAPVMETVSGPLAETVRPVRRARRTKASSVDIAREAPAPIRWPSPKQIFSSALLLGIALLLARLLARFRTLHRLLNQAATLKTQGRVSIVVSDEIAVPFSARLAGRAWVALPSALLARWMDAKLALRHELEHHRQYDTQWAHAIEWLVALFFANPAIYFWRASLQEAQELSCDRILIGRRIGRHEYASCLVRVAETALRNRHALVGTASMATASQDPHHSTWFLKRRIEMLARPSQPRAARRVSLFGTVALLGLVSLAGIAATHHAGEVGAGVVATDPTIQKIADEALRGAIQRFHASLGLVVVTDPRNGRVLAVANRDEVEKEDGSPHWALSRQLEPGSIAKGLVAAYALSKNRTRVDEVHDCGKGSYRLGDRVYHDWKDFDKLTTAEAIQMSSNICGIKIGEKVGAAGLAQALHDFGIGEGGVAENFPEARVGDYVDPKRTDPERFIAIVSSGYDAIHLTPLELLQAYGAIANGGLLLKPRNGDGKAEVVRRVLTEKAAAEMREILANVMVTGIARGSASKLYRLAGKTSTGYSRTHLNHDKLGGESSLASFIGFGPVEDPRVAIYVVIENPNDHRGVHGSEHAAPVFKEVAEKALAYLGVAPTKQ